MGAEVGEDTGNGVVSDVVGTVRPETLLLVLFGNHLLGKNRLVAVGSVIEVLTRLGAGEPAIRATVSRMGWRGLLYTVRRGRRAYIGLTAQGVRVLEDGARRIEADVVDRAWDGHWTILSFSVPETRRADRHTLRSHLGWAGFAPLRSGLWISPAHRDVSPVLAELDLLDRAEVFRAEAILWSEPEKIVRSAWDVDALADGYRRFVTRWSGDGLDRLDELCRQTLLEADWLLLIRHDPRLPIALLPLDWPGTEAQALFRALRRQLAGPADKLAGELLDTCPVPAD
jgi:DNA-binding transcriptional regulator PaaX